jgi:hypothetical protein
LFKYAGLSPESGASANGNGHAKIPAILALLRSTITSLESVERKAKTLQIDKLTAERRTYLLDKLRPSVALYSQLKNL